MTVSRTRRGFRADRQGGAALVIALLVMAALLVLGTTFLTIASTETEIARNAREAIQAFYVAETGLTRLQRDLVAQFAVPYRALCPNPGAYADLTRNVLISQEPLGLPGQRVDADGLATCAPPGTMAYYQPLDSGNQPVAPTDSTWRTLPYAGGVAGGTYRVEVRNATANNTIEARATATTDSAIGASRQIEAKFQVDRFSPAEHAVFVDWPIMRLGDGGNITFAGPVFVRGMSSSYSAIQLGYAGLADSIVNYYKNLDATLRASIPSPPVKPNPGSGELESTLDTTLRVYQGPVEIRTISSSAGEPDAPGNGVKEKLNAVYTNQGFTGSPGPDTVYADNGPWGRFDLPREMTTFPALSGPYTGAPLPGGTTPASHDAYLRAIALGVDGNLTIDSSSGGFSYPPGLSDLSQCSGNCLIYQPPTNPQGAPATPPTLMVNGVVWVRGNIVLGGSGTNRLPALYYKGAGSLYARTNATDWTGSITASSDLLPSPTKNDGTPGAQFPTDHRLGLISAQWVYIGDMAASSQPSVRIAASVYADFSILNYAPYQIAGSLMTRYFYVWRSAGIYYVPALASARPPGMPGTTPWGAGTPYFLRTLYWRDVMP